MVNLNEVLLDKNSSPIKQNYKTEVFEDGKAVEKNDYRETTLIDVLRVSLLMNNQEDIKPKDALKRYQLYRKIQGNDIIKLSNKEIKYLSKLVSSHYDVLSAGQAIEMLNK